MYESFSWHTERDSCETGHRVNYVIAHQYGSQYTTYTCHVHHCTQPHSSQSIFIYLFVEELKTNLMSLVVFISLIFAQHVSNINPYPTNVENRVSS